MFISCDNDLLLYTYKKNYLKDGLDKINIFMTTLFRNTSL